MSIRGGKSELFIGIINPVGVENNLVISNLRACLNKFNYEVIVIEVSNDIIAKFEQEKFISNSEYERIMHYMDLGNEIRKNSNDNAILMKGVSSELFRKRKEIKKGKEGPLERYAYIIKSIKHTDEIEYLRETYNDGFYLIGIQSDDKRRIKYFQQKNLTDLQAKELLERDENEELAFGQHTRDAFQHSDYFIELTEDTDLLYNSIERFVDLIFSNPYITPNFDEYAMFMAYSSSLRSADLSRQVGAVVTKENEILSLGVNDCPKYGGGLYWPKFIDKKFIDEDDGRDYKVGYDSNKKEQQNLINKILDSLEIEKTENNYIKVKNAGINDLTEYGRVVHAEMEALLCCSRNNISCRDADLYVTTFPCHNCAKHIIAAGIKRVVYIEPYPKSKAFSFYNNEITRDISDINKIHYEPFIGVGPQRFIDLFAFSSIKWAKKIRKNEKGEAIKWKREIAELRTPIAVLSYLELEKSAVMNFEDETKEYKQKGDKK